MRLSNRLLLGFFPGKKANLVIQYAPEIENRLLGVMEKVFVVPKELPVCGG